MRGKYTSRFETPCWRDQSLIPGDCELWEGELPPLKIRRGGAKNRDGGGGGGKGDNDHT
jgi:hypothetical protein